MLDELVHSSHMIMKNRDHLTLSAIAKPNDNVLFDDNYFMPDQYIHA